MVNTCPIFHKDSVIASLMKKGEESIVRLYIVWMNVMDRYAPKDYVNVEMNIWELIVALYESLF